MISSHAKAKTPFGVLAGPTTVNTEYAGDNLAVISFMCGPTPVEFALSGKNLRAFVDELIGHMGQMNREHAERQLAALDAGVSA